MLSSRRDLFIDMKKNASEVICKNNLVYAFPLFYIHTQNRHVII